MKCLRVYSTANGESHFDEVEIPTTSRQVHPNAAAFEVSAKYAASGIRFTHIPAQGCSTLSTEDHCEQGVEAAERCSEPVLRDRVGLVAA